jgi:hypothetical protein
LAHKSEHAIDGPEEIYPYPYQPRQTIDFSTFREDVGVFPPLIPSEILQNILRGDGDVNGETSRLEGMYRMLKEMVLRRLDKVEKNAHINYRIISEYYLWF